jgi:hypothetical protein
MRTLVAIVSVAAAPAGALAVGAPTAGTTAATWPGPPATAPPRVKGADGPPPTPGGFEQRFGPAFDSTPSGPTTDVIVVGPRIPEMDAER